MRWRGPIRQPPRRPVRTRPAAWREQDGEEPADRDARQSLDNGTKRAQIGKASGYTHR